MRKAWVVWLLACLSLSAGLGAETAGGAVRVQQATDVVREWRFEQHLYVKGELGLGEAQLAELERWLDTQATNWTVVLAESAADERFTDAAGATYAGMDAVEHALGKGLPNQTPFGQITDPRTGERNGAFFVLFLRDRKFSYYGSDAQDRRGLGEDRWQGQLDQPAIAAMRGGGRIADAAKDTIRNIEDQITRRIAGEKADRVRRAEAEKAERERTEAAAALARQRTLEQAKASLQTGTAALDDLNRRLAAVLRDRPELSGDVAHPDVAAWAADLAAAGAALEQGNPAAAAGLAEAVKTRVGTAVRGLEDFVQAGPALDAVGRDLDRIAAHPHAVAARQSFEAGKAALAQGRAAWARGDSGYGAQLAVARQQVQAAQARVEAAVRDAVARRQLRLAGGVGGVVGLLGLGFGLNWRRRASKREALSLIEAWAKAIDEKTFALFDLVDRARRTLGASATDAAQRHAGRTLELSQQAIRDVDEMVIMSACATRVLEDARLLATPRGAGSRLFNLFATGKYRAAVRRLRDEPVVFQPEEGLELAVRGARSERETLLGSLESYQPFRFSFSDLMTAFNERATRALGTLDRVESALAKVGSFIETAHQNVQTARAAEPELRQAAGSTTVFLADPVFANLLPAAAGDLAEAVKTSVRDAVSAMETCGATGAQKAADALALIRLAGDFHKTTAPQLRECQQQLASVPLATTWLDQAVLELSARADELARTALAGSAAEGIGGVRTDLQALAERTSRVVALDSQRRKETEPAIAAAEALASQTRCDLAPALGQPADAVLHESNRDPSERTDAAREQLAGVKAALERGDILAARNGLDAADRLVAEAVTLVEAARQAFTEHEGTLAGRRAETARLDAVLPEHDAILAAIRSEYAPAVLGLGQGDPTHPNANGTVADNLEEAREHRDAAVELTTTADQAFRAARILEAAERLRQAAARHEQARFRLDEIREKQQRLRETDAANATLEEQLRRRVIEIAPAVNDSRTMATTLQACTAAVQRLDAAAQARTVVPRDPFQSAVDLAAVREAFAVVADRARRDWEVFTEARRSFEAAGAQIGSARGLAQQAATDNVADSTAIHNARAELGQLEVALGQVQGALAAPHGDWSRLDAEADRIANAAGRVNAVLRGELEAARAALDALGSASSHVRSAGGWTGALGVAIFGTPGSDLLGQARAALERGDYRQAQSAAESARRLAQAAIAEAEAEVQRRRRAEEARRERERREREAAESRRRSSSGSSGFGRSGFSSGSGSSRSSFRSGSGASRSGW